MKSSTRELVILDELFPEQSKEAEAIRALLTDIFNRFEISNDFKFKQEFLSRLASILNIGEEYEAQISWDILEDSASFPDVWENWLQVTSEAFKRHVDIYGNSSSSRLFGLKTTGSKSVDCLFNNLGVEDSASGNQKGLCLLYIAFLMLPSFRTQNFNINEITRTFNYASTLDIIFNHIPLDPQEGINGSYLENISSYCQGIVSESKYGKKYTDFLRRLDEVVRLFHSGQYKHQRKNSHKPVYVGKAETRIKKKRSTVQRFTKFHDIPQDNEYEPVGTFETILDGATGEQVLALLESESEAPDRLLIPKEVRDSELRVGSKFWIQNFSESTSWNLNGINPFTLKILLNWLAKNDSRESLIFNLMLCLGLKIPSLLNLEIGINKDICRDGQYRRTYIPPENHYTPKDSDKSLLLPTQESLTIELPSFVVKQLRKYVDFSAEGLSLARALNTSVEKTEEDISKINQELIGQGATGLARDRIHVSLRKKLSIITGDEFLGYIITGSEKEAPPVSSYYSRISISLVQKVYDQAIKAIFS